MNVNVNWNIVDNFHERLCVRIKITNMALITVIRSVMDQILVKGFTNASMVSDSVRETFTSIQFKVQFPNNTEEMNFKSYSWFLVYMVNVVLLSLKK